jgi:hypothetical protein
MDRRTALKNITLTFGYAVATPTVLSVLQSCKSNVATWTPMFFSPAQGYMITQLADIILPTTDIPGALDVNVPEFMDKMLHDIAPEDKRNIIKEGANAFEKEFQNVYKKDLLKGSKVEYEKLLGKYFDISEAEKTAVFKMQNTEESIKEEELNTYLIYKFLLAIKEYTLFGYYTSELVGETILSYDPVPGSWEACIPVEDVGNAWSL